MKTSKILIFLLGFGIFLAACTQTAVTSPTPEDISVATAALGTPAAQETAVQVAPTQETAALGTPAASGTPATLGTPANVGKTAVNAAIAAVMKDLNVDANQVKIIAVEAVEWPNGCLGIQRMGVLCTQAIVPGYRVILEASGKQYEYHTNETGSIALPAVAQTPAPLPQVTGPVVHWEQTQNSDCIRVEIDPQRVAYGHCLGALVEAPLASERLKELEFFMATYKSFSQETKAGKVVFNGTGSREPDEAEMRSIAEWAALIDKEVRSGRSDPAGGLAFNWHREGGLAGFCDDLAVYRTGWALPLSCKSSTAQAAGPYRLSAGELEKMYAWVDQLTSFNYEQKDAAAANSMLVRLSLVGSGVEKASPAQQEEIAVFAGQVYANAVNK